MDEDTKVCPVCGETIKAVAIKCRFCNTDLAAFAGAKTVEAEKDLFSGHPAVIYSAGQFVPFFLAAVVASGVGYSIGSDPGVLYGALLFVVLCAIIWLFFYLKSVGTHYRITTQRIKLERGVISKVQESLELFRIDHFELRKPIGERLLGMASLHLFSSDAELSNFVIYAIPNLESLADTLRECQLRERSRRSLTTFVKA